MDLTCVWRTYKRRLLSAEWNFTDNRRHKLQMEMKRKCVSESDMCFFLHASSFAGCKHFDENKLLGWFAFFSLFQNNGLGCRGVSVWADVLRYISTHSHACWYSNRNYHFVLVSHYLEYMIIADIVRIFDFPNLLIRRSIGWLDGFEITRTYMVLGSHMGLLRHMTVHGNFDFVRKMISPRISPSTI